MVANPILITSRVAHAYLWFYVFMHTETAYKMPDSHSYTRLMPNIVLIKLSLTHSEILNGQNIIDTKILYILCFIFGGDRGGGGGGGGGEGGTARQDYFTHFEPSQSLRRKREIPKINHLATCKQNLACPTCDLSYAWTHIGEMTSDLECLRWLTTRARGLLNFVLPTL